MKVAFQACAPVLLALVLCTLAGGCVTNYVWTTPPSSGVAVTDWSAPPNASLKQPAILDIRYQVQWNAPPLWSVSEIRHKRLKLANVPEAKSGPGIGQGEEHDTGVGGERIDVAGCLPIIKRPTDSRTGLNPGFACLIIKGDCSDAELFIPASQSASGKDERRIVVPWSERVHSPVDYPLAALATPFTLAFDLLSVPARFLAEGLEWADISAK